VLDDFHEERRVVTRVAGGEARTEVETVLEEPGPGLVIGLNAGHGPHPGPHGARDMARTRPEVEHHAIRAQEAMLEPRIHQASVALAEALALCREVPPRLNAMVARRSRDVQVTAKAIAALQYLHQARSERRDRRRATDGAGVAPAGSARGQDRGRGRGHRWNLPRRGDHSLQGWVMRLWHRDDDFTNRRAGAAPAAGMPGMSSPRILMLHPALAPYRVDMFNALARRCPLRLVFLLANVPNQAFDQERLRGLLEIEPAYLLRGPTIAGRTLRRGISEEIRRYSPDVVVTSEFGQATLMAVVSRPLMGGSFAIVAGTEDNPASVQRDTWLHRQGRRFLLSRVDGILTYSSEAQALYRNTFRARPPVGASALVQSETVLTDRLAGAVSAARNLAEAHGLAGRRVLLYVGRLAPEKRVDRLVDAMARVRQAHPEGVLAIVGDGPERERLVARAAPGIADGSILFAGRQEGEALAAWYRLGSVFALPSEHEPFGAVVNEALVAGMPVVCSDRAGARVLVSPERNGAVVDASRPDALADALTTWVGRVPPISIAKLEAVRPSLMATTFDAALTGYLAMLDAAIDYRRRQGR